MDATCSELSLFLFLPELLLNQFYKLLFLFLTSFVSGKAERVELSSDLSFAHCLRLLRDLSEIRHG